MEVVTLEDLALRNMVNKALVAFLSTLMEMLGYFSVDGERILHDCNGYRNRKWVEALFEVAANEGYFRKPSMRAEDALPYAVVQPLITNELIADICLADNLLKALYHEYLFYDYQLKFTNAPKVPHTVRRHMKELRSARQDFCRQKTIYLRIAYRGRVPRKYRSLYDVANCTQEFVGEIKLDSIFSIMPTISQLHPRDNASDAIPISKLCRKYASLRAFCDEAIASLPV